MLRLKAADAVPMLLSAAFFMLKGLWNKWIGRSAGVSAVISAFTGDHQHPGFNFRGSNLRVVIVGQSDGHRNRSHKSSRFHPHGSLIWQRGTCGVLGRGKNFRLQRHPAQCGVGNHHDVTFFGHEEIGLRGEVWQEFSARVIRIDHHGVSNHILHHGGVQTDLMHHAVKYHAGEMRRR